MPFAKSLPPTFLGFGFMTLAKVLGGLLVVKLGALHLGPDGFGRLGQLMTLVIMISIFAGGGITNALIQGLAATDKQSDRARLWGAALKIYVVEGVLVGLLLAVFRESLAELLLGQRDFAWLFIVLAASQFFTGANNLLQGALSVLGQTSTIIWVNVLGNVLGALAFAWVLLRDGLEGAALGAVLYPAATGVVGVVSALCVLPASWRAPNWHSTRADMKGLLSYSLVVLVSVMALPFAQLLVRDMVAAQAGWAQVGYWQGVLKISDIYMQFFGMVLIYLVLPQCSAARDLSTLDRVWMGLVKPIMAVMLCGLALFYLLRQFVLPILFSDAFVPAAGYVLPQALADAFRMVGLFVVYYGISRGARLMPVLFEVVQAVLLVFVTAWLLPRYAGLAPAYAMVIGSMFALLAMLVVRHANRSHWNAPAAVVQVP